MTRFLAGEELETELNGREPLTGDIRLYEKSNKSDAKNEADFKIEGVIHAGGSCICYRAVRSIGGISQTGMLKEFYPIDSDFFEYSYHLKRYGVDSENAKQLYSEQSTLKNFKNAKQEFFSSYEKLSRLRRVEENMDNFFAPIHIYQGIAQGDDKENCTIYIWSPGDNLLKSFDDYLDERQKAINEEISAPKGNLSLFLSYELRTILRAIRYLAIGVEQLHYQNTLHLDIKPSNFGIRPSAYDYRDGIVVSLFDVNTLYTNSINPMQMRTAGTPGFRGPEMVDDRYNNYKNIRVGCKSDIYSLGATLYNSIVMTSSGRGLYSPERFSSIGLALNRSRLIELSDYNSRAELKELLISILKRSLARRAPDYSRGFDNYWSVGQFIHDIEEAEKKVEEEITLAEKAGATNQAVVTLIDNEEFYSQQIDGGAVGSMQRFLYDHPLYNYIDSNGNLNLLVLGFGAFGQKFVDIALELSQIKGCYPRITVVTKDKNMHKASYLESRPEFKSYFEVDGNQPLHDNYGSVRFIETSLDFSCDNTEGNAELLKKALGCDEKFSYAFISLSDELLNQRVACYIADSDIVGRISGVDHNCAINFVTYKDLEKEEEVKREKEAQDENYSIFGGAFDAALLKAEENNIELRPVEIGNALKKHRDYSFLNRMAFNCHMVWGGGLSGMAKSYRDFCDMYNYTSSVAIALSIKYKLHSIGIELDEAINEVDRAAREKKLNDLTEAYRNKIGISGNATEDQKDCLNQLTVYEHRRWLVNMICQSYRELPAEDFKNLGATNKDTANFKHSCIVPSTSEWALNNEFWNADLSRWDDEDIENTPQFEALDPLDKMSVNLHRHFMTYTRNFDIENIEDEAKIVSRMLQNNAEALSAFNMYTMSLRAMVSTIKSGKNITRVAVNNIQEAIRRYFDRVKSCVAAIPNANEVTDHLKSINSAVARVALAHKFNDYKSNDHHLIRNIPFILNYNKSIQLYIPLVIGESAEEWLKNVDSSIVINPSTVTYLACIDNTEEGVPLIESTLSNISRVMDGHELQTNIELVLYIRRAEDNPLSEADKEKIEKQLRSAASRICRIDIVIFSDDNALRSKLHSLFENDQRYSARCSAIGVNNGTISDAVRSIEGVYIPVYEFDTRNKTFNRINDDYIWFSDIPFNVHLNVEDMLAGGRISAFSEFDLLSKYDSLVDECYISSPIKIKAWNALCARFRKKLEEENALMNICALDNVSYIKEFMEQASRTIRAFSWSCVESQEESEVLAAAKEILKYLSDSGYIFKFGGSDCDNQFGLYFVNEKSKELLTDETKILQLYTYYKILEKGFFDDVKIAVENSSDGSDECSVIIAVKGFNALVIGMSTQSTCIHSLCKRLKGNAGKLGTDNKPVIISVSAVEADADMCGVDIVSAQSDNDIGEALIRLINQEKGE